ncbi:MAG: QacE family quaternary ammonium compound efflux SMR transporter [Alphaproteobacteria bacterium HGW-Alphaproteobacteria-2]|nr:MAG: QacE family quaternary ammonium compound efflux SMR transporter [Alphaproteobacteria bacterium HGW-Alphaproteobacteria-2]
MTQAYLLLLVAVLFEALGTTSLQASQQFTRLVPSLGVLLGFGAAFYLFTLVLRTLPLGVTYAVWSGLGICLTALIGWLVFRQPVDGPALLGMGMIVAGIAVIRVFSQTAAH